MTGLFCLDCCFSSGLNPPILSEAPTRAAGTITLNGTSLSIEDAGKIAAGEADVTIAPEAVKLLEDSHKLVMASAAQGLAVYGLTVGVGLNKDQKLFTADGKLSPEVLETSRAFNYNALRSHSASVSEMMPVDLARLSMVVRLNTLLAGKFGAQVRVAELYRDMLNKNVTPLIPSEGSVGEADILLASHVGAVMIGEWKADVKGKVMTGADALKAAGIKPLQPEGKDALAILSNNSVAMAYAIDAARNAERIVEMTPTIYGLSLEGLNGNVAPILPQTIGARPFDGLSQTAAACIMTMCVSALALTTLDAVGRNGRMSFQELFSVDEGQEMTTIQKICVNKYFATVITLFFGFLLCLGGYMNIWPLFGSANQLLSAMVLICLTVFLKTTGRKSFMLYVPMVVMFCVTMTALVESAYALIIKIASGNWSLLIEGLQFVLAIALMVLAVSIVYHCGKELIHADDKTAHQDAQPTATH